MRYASIRCGSSSTQVLAVGHAIRKYCEFLFGVYTSLHLLVRHALSDLLALTGSLLRHHTCTIGHGWSTMIALALPDNTVVGNSFENYKDAVQCNYETAKVTRRAVRKYSRAEQYASTR